MEIYRIVLSNLLPRIQKQAGVMMFVWRILSERRCIITAHNLPAMSATFKYKICIFSLPFIYVFHIQVNGGGTLRWSRKIAGGYHGEKAEETFFMLLHKNAVIVHIPVSLILQAQSKPLTSDKTHIQLLNICLSTAFPYTWKILTYLHIHFHMYGMVCSP